MGKMIGGLLGKVFGIGADKPAPTPAQPASSAAPASAPTLDTVASSTANTLRKKSKGKSSLTINSGSASGTGLNV